VGLNTEFWRDRPTLVTGATGLVGGWLVRGLIERGANVICLVRDWVPRSMLLATDLSQRVSLVRGSITDQAALERVLGEYEVEVAIHLAAQTQVLVANQNPVSTFDSNIRGTWGLLEACRRSPTVRSVVVASSDKAYGDHQAQAYTEDMPLRARHPYDVSKACADMIAQTYAFTYEVPVAITRCGNFFGGGDLNWNRIIPGTIRSLHRRHRPVIRSTGRFTRDYFYVEDGIAAYLLLAERLTHQPELRGHAFNFSYEAPATVLELVASICRLMDVPLEPEVRGEALHEIAHQQLSAQKARRELEWTPAFSMEEGLRRTVNWYTAFLDQHDHKRVAV